MENNKVSKLIYIISFVVFALVVLLYNLPQADHLPTFITYLPKLNATLNGTCFILLLISLNAIKKKNVVLHKKLNITAFLLSALFLLSYVTFHSFGIETFFPSDNPLRGLYFFILISHIILAAVVLPLILLSFYKGFKGEIKEHKRITRWSMPIWLYVTLSGVIVYLMISPYYNF